MIDWLQKYSTGCEGFFDPTSCSRICATHFARCARSRLCLRRCIDSRTGNRRQHSRISVVNTILLRRFPFVIRTTRVARGEQRVGGLLTPHTVWTRTRSFQRDNHSFQEITAFVPYYSISETKLMGRASRNLFPGLVAANFFQTLACSPCSTAFFSPEECVKGGSRGSVEPPILAAAVGADPSIIGKRFGLIMIRLPSSALPERFDFRAVFAPGAKMDIFVRPSWMAFRIGDTCLSMVAVSSLE